MNNLCNNQIINNEVVEFNLFILIINLYIKYINVIDEQFVRMDRNERVNCFLVMKIRFYLDDSIDIFKNKIILFKCKIKRI